MADIFTPEKRSAVMAAIRGHNTKPERIVRSMLHRAGFRFTVNGPNNKRLPGKPDVVLAKHHTVVFIHGCFWHGHDDCGDFRLPKTRRGWWQKKISGNKARDARTEEALRQMGWHVVTIWACAVKNRDAKAWLEARLPSLISPTPPTKRDAFRYPETMAEEPAARAADAPDPYNLPRV
jgi:DNA mismatch endonuclease (patch repair protein)